MVQTVPSRVIGLRFQDTGDGKSQAFRDCTQNTQYSRRQFCGSPVEDLTFSPKTKGRGSA